MSLHFNQPTAYLFPSIQIRRDRIFLDSGGQLAWFDCRVLLVPVDESSRSFERGIVHYKRKKIQSRKREPSHLWYFQIHLHHLHGTSISIETFLTFPVNQKLFICHGYISSKPRTLLHIAGLLPLTSNMDSLRARFPWFSWTEPTNPP